MCKVKDFTSKVNNRKAVSGIDLAGIFSAVINWNHQSSGVVIWTARCANIFHY